MSPTAREIPAPEFRVVPIHSGFVPGVDPLKLNHLNDQPRGRGLRRNLAARRVGANLVTDSHIAAIAMEYQAEVHSNDTDFSRFPVFAGRNPLLMRQPTAVRWEGDRRDEGCHVDGCNRDRSDWPCWPSTGW